MVRFRQAFLIIAGICILIIGIQHITVINAFKDLQSGDELSIEENIRNTFDASIIVGIILEVMSLLTMIFLFVDNNAKHKFLGIGHLVFCVLLSLFTSQAKETLEKCLNSALNDNGHLIIDPKFDVDSLTSCSELGLVLAIFLLILVVIGIVSGETELKRQKAE